MSEPVSPADTIRRVREDLQFALVPLGRGRAVEILSMWDALHADRDAALAVGERDKAEIAQAKRERTHYRQKALQLELLMESILTNRERDRAEIAELLASEDQLAGELAEERTLTQSLIAAGERDRQHIERLTEVLRRLSEWDMLTVASDGSGLYTADAPYWQSEIAAVLADHGHADWHQCSDCYNRAAGEGDTAT